jgi:hypothetical protein
MVKRATCRVHTPALKLPDTLGASAALLFL